MTAAKGMLLGFDITKKPMANGVVNPNVKNIPAINIPRYPKDPKFDTND